MTSLDFLTSVRIAVDFKIGEDAQVDVNKVRLALFGTPGTTRELKKSINGSVWTSWYITFDDSQDLSEVTVHDLTDDPTHHDVFYLVFKDEEVSDSWKYSSCCLHVLEYIALVVTNLAETHQSASPSKSRGNKRPRVEEGGDFNKDFVDYFDHFFHILDRIYVPTFLTLLRSPLEGFSWNGTREGEFCDPLLLVVEKDENLDPTSSAVYVSRRTVKPTG